VRHFWSQPHFYVAVLAQFLYVAAQAGVWSFFVNYMTSQTPSVPESWVKGLEHLQASIPASLGGWLGGWFKTQPDGAIFFTDKGASTLASVAFLFFVAGRFTGSGILKRASAHRVLGFYGGACMLLCLLVFLKLGWVSVVSVFFSYFFMSIIFPTIFALGIFGLGEQAKKASSFIVMAIFGGAVLPKLMGMVADRTDLSRGFIVPLICFAVVALYGFLWPRLSGHEGMQGVNTSRGH
jgi:FHS family L-fucose permease-like MFS transporter